MSNNATKIQNVLLVDDDDNIRLITEMALEGLTSWTIKQARNGAEALECIERQLPDLILLDVMMPDMSGIAVLEILKSRHGAQMPLIIFMTAKVQVGEVEKYHTLGAAGVILKPFDPMSLHEEIEAIIERARA
jgi:two-component system OmpR family response regulator